MKVQSSWKIVWRGGGLHERIHVLKERGDEENAERLKNI